MDKIKFSELWEQVRNIAEDIENSCKHEVSFNEEKKTFVEYEYDNFRKSCKAHLVKGTQVPKDIDESNVSMSPRLDRHKVAACIAGAILKARPLDAHLSSQEGHCNLSYFCNEALALFSALGIIISFIRSDSQNKIQLDVALKEDFLNRGFLFPSPVHGTYLPWLLFVLQESSQIGFNVLSFSNILYLLEIYTLSQLKIERLESIDADINEQ